jgi:hypothetical protein
MPFSLTFSLKRLDTSSREFESLGQVVWLMTLLKTQSMPSTMAIPQFANLFSLSGLIR